MRRCPPRRYGRSLDAWHDGLGVLDARFAAVWGAIALDGAGPADVDAVLDGGAVGGCRCPPGALSTPERLERAGPLLEGVERHARPAPAAGLRGAGGGAPLHAERMAAGAARRTPSAIR